MESKILLRLQFLVRVVRKECKHLRNQMVHEYIEDPTVLSSALQTGHAFVPILIAAANKMITEIVRRGWA